MRQVNNNLREAARKINWSFQISLQIYEIDVCPPPVNTTVDNISRSLRVGGGQGQRIAT